MGTFDFMQITNRSDFYPRDDEVKGYCDSLRKAFIDSQADYIVLDSHPGGNRFLYRATRWAIKQGILRQDTTVDESQSMIWSFRLTSDGLGKLLGDAIGNPLPLDHSS